MHAIDDRPAFIVHGWKHIAAVLRAAEQAHRPVWLFTPVAASYSFGVGFWAAIQERIAELHPEADVRMVIDCDDAAGHVMAALRSGLRWLVFEGNAAARRRLLDIVAQSGAELVQRRPDALDLLQVKDADTAIAAHLEA
jgi:fructose/tagatose bisphosphate aldolase